jgi:membrane-bound metal-dependent hydrolase YbcI (DUF457 family)
MLPRGHLAAGALAGAVLAVEDGTCAPGVWIVGTALAANVPDLDVLYPLLLDRLAVQHALVSGEHHRWLTHAPLFWTLALPLLAHAARSRHAPPSAPAAVKMLGVGVGIHLLQDVFANSVALAWPRKQQYGLHLDGGLGTMADHLEYARRYHGSVAWHMENVLTAAAAVVSAYAITRSRRR